MTVTDHGTFAGCEELFRAYDGIPLGMTLFHGEEVHAPYNYVHIVNFGANSSINEVL